MKSLRGGWETEDSMIARSSPPKTIYYDEKTTGEYRIKHLTKLVKGPYGTIPTLERGQLTEFLPKNGMSTVPSWLRWHTDLDTKEKINNVIREQLSYLVSQKDPDHSYVDWLYHLWLWPVEIAVVKRIHALWKDELKQAKADGGDLQYSVADIKRRAHEGIARELVFDRSPNGNLFRMGAEEGEMSFRLG